MTDTYPATLSFDLAGDRREQVLAAAERLGLTLTLGEGDRFDVIVPSAGLAYNFGLETVVSIIGTVVD